MYNYDTLPAKTFFKIAESGDLSLLGEGTPEELEAVFAEIQNQREADDSTGQGKSKELDIMSQIEALAAKYKAVKWSVYYLRFLADQELEDYLRGQGYALNEATKEADLDKIDTITQGILIKIESIRKRLPKREKTEKSPPFDQVALSYCALLEMGYVDTNKITISQYDSVVTLGNRKMDALNKLNNGGK